MNNDLPDEMLQTAEALLLERQRRMYLRGFDQVNLPAWVHAKLAFAAKASQVEVVLALTKHYSQSSSVPLLDIGCGFGTFVMACLDKGIDAYGVDIAPGEIEFARQRFAYATGNRDMDRFSVQDGAHLPFADASFTLVTLWSVLEHVKHWQQLLDEATRVLAPGGLLLINSPNYWGVWKEPHYEVFWPPLFKLCPRQWVSTYLRLRGYDPRPFETGLNLIGLPELVGDLRNRDLDPFFGNVMLFRSRGVCQRLGKFVPRGIIEWLYARYCAFPLRRNVFVIARKK